MRASKFLASGAVLATLMAPAAWADVTAEQVWQDWQDVAAASGQTITAGSTDRGNGRLTLSNVMLTAKGSGDRRAVVTVPRLDFTEKEGAVAIDLSPDYTAVVQGSLENDAGPRRMTIGISHPGLVMTASGDPGDITYDYAAPQLTVDLRQAEEGGAPVKDMDFEAAVKNLSGKMHISGTGEAQRQEQSSRADSMTLTLALAPENGQTMQSHIIMRDLTSVADLPGGLSAPVGILPAFDARKEGRADSSFSSLEAQVDANGTGTFTVNLSQGRQSAAVSGGAATFEGEVADGRIGMDVGRGEAPFELGFSRATSLARVPLTKTEAPQDAALTLSLEQITGSDSLWSLIDANGVLPRDPGNLLLDLAGRMRWLVDPADPAAMEASEGRIAAVDLLTINDIDIALAGARLTGQGELTFPEVPEGAGGLERPLGRIDLALTGGNALLDRLTQIGLVPSQQAMVVRMLVSGFTRPGEGPDTLVSRLDFGPGGTISANGRQVQ